MATTVRETLADFGRFDPELHAPEHRRLKPAYGFDDIAIIPGVETLHPDDVDLSWEMGGHRFAIPFIASPWTVWSTCPLRSPWASSAVWRY